MIRKNAPPYRHLYGVFVAKRATSSQPVPKHISSTELTPLLEAIHRFPSGASVSQISQALSEKLPLRTLQRWLEMLVAQKQIVRMGAGRGSRYSAPEPPKGKDQAPALPAADFHPAVQLAVSIEAESIRSAVRAPLHERQPVAYRREFLESYQPNRTEYLPAAMRRRLAEIGAAPGGELPAGTYARQIFHRLLIDLSWNSSRLEGNTYSLLETEKLLALGETATGKDARDAQMILNHKAAIELLVEQAAEIGFNRYTICNLHALLAENLLGDPQGGGRLRTIAVQIGGTTFQPLQAPPLIEECFDLILARASAISDPFEQAFFAMVHLPYLQPFEDVNKRVSRFAANIPLIRRNLCPLSFVDLPVRDYIDGVLAVYELNRIELLRDVFAWAYERSCARYAAVRQSLGEPDPLRLRYRVLIMETVGTIIRERMDRASAVDYIRHHLARSAPAQDQSRLIEVIETEIISLHEGNFARYRIRPSEFASWRESWR